MLYNFNNDENFYVNNYDGININNGSLNEYNKKANGRKVVTGQIQYDRPQVDLYQPIGYNSNSQYIKNISSIPSNSEIELYKKNTFVSTPRDSFANDYNGHFSLPIRSGSPNRTIISNIFAATSPHTDYPEAFDGNNPYIDWMKHKDNFSTNEYITPSNECITSSNEYINPYNYSFILKVILFIILIILMVVLCVYSSKTSQKKINKKNIFTSDIYND
jgi:hypothetical protein